MKRGAIEQYITRRYPDIKWVDVARNFGVPIHNVRRIAKEMGCGNLKVDRKAFLSQKRKQKLGALVNIPKSECISDRCVWYRHTGECRDPIHGTVQQGTCIWRECRLRKNQKGDEYENRTN